MIKCIYCKGSSVKNGLHNQTQTYKCKECNKSFRLNYIRKRHNYIELVDKLVQLHNEGLGVNSISRVLGISAQTVLRFMIRKSNEILLELPKREIAYNSTWEIDEIYTFNKNKNNECWITYILNHKTKEVFDFVVVSSRSKEKMGPLLYNLFEYNPKKIHSDKLSTYLSLIPKSIHKTVRRCTNYIERNHLTLRNHIKRLNRKTLSFSKSLDMISVSMRLYFFG